MPDPQITEFLEGRSLSLETASTFGMTITTKDKRTAIKYPTGCGVDRVKFLDGAKPKVKWQRRGGVPHFYNLERARSLGGELWLVNGEPSVWACDQNGIAAVCTCGGETAMPSQDWLLRLAGLDRRVNIVFDNDEAGLRGSVALAQTMLELGFDVVVRRWTELIRELEIEDAQGFDVDDLHRLMGPDLQMALCDLEIYPVERADKPAPWSHSHWHLADVVARRIDYKDGPGLIHDGRCFWRYEPARGVWKEISDTAYDKETGSLDGTSIQAGEKTKVLSVTGGLLDSVRKCGRTQFEDPSFFDAAPRGVQFNNGFLDASTMQIGPSSPDLCQQFAVGVDYVDGADCPLWLAALDALFYTEADAQACKDMLQEFAGAILFGITGKVLFLEGGGENGKSTVIDVISSLVPDEVRCSIAPHLLSGSGGPAQYFVSTLAGKRLNVDADIPAGEMVESSEFKKSVTGDEITGRNPAGRPFTFRPRILHLFSANKLPGTRDHSHGFWRRILVLPLSRNFSTDPDTGVSMDLQRLRASVPSEEFGRTIFAMEAAGIVSWAVEGAKRLMSNGGAYTVPSTTTEAMDDWKQNSDQVLMFLSENYDDDVKLWTSAQDLFKAYKLWAAETSHGTLSRTSFGMRMRDLGWTEKRGRKRKGRGGVIQYKLAKRNLVPSGSEAGEDSEIPF